MENSLLFKLLLKKNSLLGNKAIELKNEMEECLGYIPLTFHHYTSHSIKHSERIIKQLSLILFDQNKEAIAEFSDIEIYILICAAILHDVGMVCSEHEKVEILKSNDWKKFCEQNQDFQKDKDKIFLDKESYDLKESFKSNLLLRLYIAEYVRRNHHLRIKRFLELEDKYLHHFFLKDTSLRKTIEAVIIGHGLEREVIKNDNSEFPPLRTILDSQVNVKVISTLFRIGDLLDFDCNRACPLVKNVVSPLPSNSKAHWSQFERITKSISHEEIAVIAECESQEEHNVLFNWFKWLVDEIVFAKSWIPHQKRHNSLQLPNISIGENGTIKVGPSKTARYKPREWKFNFDNNNILDHFIYSVHSSSIGFINELVQNSLDAIRCRASIEATKENLSFKNGLELSELDIMSKYFINIKFGKAPHPLLKNEEVDFISIKDSGVGMSEDVIKNYFLQIGKSFYNDPRFSQNFSFNPINKFGVGFLSVFSVCNYVTIETRHIESTEGIKLSLKGPSSYFLVEEVEQDYIGTEVKLFLDKTIDTAKIVNHLKRFCERSEIKIEVVDENNNTSIISPPNLPSYPIEIDILNKEISTVKIKTLNIRGDNFKGEIYMLIEESSKGDDLTKKRYYEDKYEESHPAAKKIRLPFNKLFHNGLMMSRQGSFLEPSNLHSVVIDYRGDLNYSNLERSNAFKNSTQDFGYINHEVNKTISTVLTTHLRGKQFKTPHEQYIYNLKLMDCWDNLDFWITQPSCFSFFESGKKMISKIEKVIGNFTISLNQYDQKILDDDFLLQQSATFPKEKFISISEFSMIPSRIRSYILSKINLFSVSIEKNKEKQPCLLFKFNENVSNEVSSIPLNENYFKEVPVIPIENDSDILGGSFLRFFSGGVKSFFLNSRHPFTKWLIDLPNQNVDKSYNLHKIQRRIIDLLDTPITIGGFKFELLEDYLNELSSYGYEELKAPKLKTEFFIDPYKADIIEEQELLQETINQLSIIKDPKKSIKKASLNNTEKKSTKKKTAKKSTKKKTAKKTTKKKTAKKSTKKKAAKKTTKKKTAKKSAKKKAAKKSTKKKTVKKARKKKAPKKNP